MRISFIALLALALTGCGFTPFLYKTDIVQGNIFTDSELSRIQPGMTRNEVERILGTPQLAEPFHDRRSDYIYDYFAGESRRHYQRSATIYYNQAGLVERVEQKNIHLQPATGLFSHD